MFWYVTPGSTTVGTSDCEPTPVPKAPLLSEPQHFKTPAMVIPQGATDSSKTQFSIVYNSYEITSSSMHSLNFPGAPDVVPNKRKIVGTGKRNYVLIDSTATGTGARFSATSYGSEGNVIFRKDFSV